MKKYHNLVTFFVLLFGLNNATLMAQVDSLATLQKDSVIVDTLRNIEVDTLNSNQKFSLKRFLKKDYPDPNKAALLALILPGTGQVYNKKYWKVPFVYAGLGATIYFASRQEIRYRFYRDNYLYRVDQEATTESDPRLVNLSDETLKTIRNRYDKSRQQLYAGCIAVWLLQAMDAYVDAHLTNFDVDENLTLKINPNTISSPIGNTYGLGLQLTFKPKKKEPLKSLLISP